LKIATQYGGVGGVVNDRPNEMTTSEKKENNVRFIEKQAVERTNKLTAVVEVVSVADIVVKADF
jgi:hypothetical protein